MLASVSLQIMAETLGEFIRNHREQKDMSLRELAKQAGVTAVFLSDVELGRRFPKEETLEKIAHALCLSVEDMKKHDARAPISDIRRISVENPSLGFAFRKAVENVKSGTLTPEELIRRLNGKREPDE